MKYYTVPQLAKMFNLSETQIRRLVYTGKLPARRWGKRIIFLEDDLKEYFKNLPLANPYVK